MCILRIFLYVEMLRNSRNICRQTFLQEKKLKNLAFIVSQILSGFASFTEKAFCD